MKPASLDVRPLFYKAFFLSLAAHIMCVVIFSFTFHSPEREPDPFFTFLGSILRDRDFVLQPRHPSLSDEDRLTVAMPSGIELDRHKAKHEKTFQIKPPYQPASLPGEKINSKSLFEATLTPAKASDEEIREILNIETTAPARVPLRLRP